MRRAITEAEWLVILSAMDPERLAHELTIIVPNIQVDELGHVWDRSACWYTLPKEGD